MKKGTHARGRRNLAALMAIQGAPQNRSRSRDQRELLDESIAELKARRENKALRAQPPPQPLP